MIDVPIIHYTASNTSADPKLYLTRREEKAKVVGAVYLHVTSSIFNSHGLAVLVKGSKFYIWSVGEGNCGPVAKLALGDGVCFGNCE